MAAAPSEQSHTNHSQSFLSRIKTFNQTYGCYDARSPIYKPFLQSTSTQHIRTQSPIQFSDLTFIPPKKYGPDNFSKFQNRQFPTYPLDKVVPEDYQRVMKEYKVIEDQDAAKRKKYDPLLIKEVSPKKLKEKELRNFDPLKLKKNDIPVSVLMNIDKLIRLQLKQISPQLLNKIKQTQSKMSIRNENMNGKKIEVENVETGGDTESRQPKFQDKSGDTEQQQLRIKRDEALKGSGLIRTEDQASLDDDSQNYPHTPSINLDTINNEVKTTEIKNTTEVNENTHIKQLQQDLDNEHIDDFNDWVIKKEIENKLRSDMIKEALKALEERRKEIILESYEETELKQKWHQEWFQQKQIQDKFNKMMEEQVKKMQKLQKQQKQARNKSEYQQWLQKHCEKIRQKNEEERLKKLQESQIREIQMLRALERKQRAEQEFKRWKREKSKSQRKESKAQEELLAPDYSEMYPWVAKVKRSNSTVNRKTQSQAQFTSGTVNIMINTSKKNGNPVSYNNGGDQGEYMQSPQRYSEKKSIYTMQSPQLVQRKTSGKKPSSKKKSHKKRKFSINTKQMKSQKPYIDRISEEKSSEEGMVTSSGQSKIGSKKIEGNDEISEIYHNQSQPIFDGNHYNNNTVENMIYGMEANH